MKSACKMSKDSKSQHFLYEHKTSLINILTLSSIILTLVWFHVRLVNLESSQQQQQQIRVRSEYHHGDHDSTDFNTENSHTTTFQVRQDTEDVIISQTENHSKSRVSFS